MPRDGTLVAAPAVGLSLTMNIAGDRQIVMQTHFDQDQTDDEANALADRMFRLADRQKAKYELDGLREDLAKHQKTLAQMTEDRTRLDIEHEHAQAARVVELQAVQEKGKEVHDAAYDKHVKSGRQGPFEPKGATASHIRANKGAFEKIRIEIEKAEAERAQHISNMEISEKRYHEEIARLCSEISKRESLLG